jgi:hypothetical protein
LSGAPIQAQAPRRPGPDRFSAVTIICVIPITPSLYFIVP